MSSPLQGFVAPVDFQRIGAGGAAAADDPTQFARALIRKYEAAVPELRGAGSPPRERTPAGRGAA
ncbi:hypothetical protein [Leucobacter chromiireducens]|uniref:hypothetical protein n=1 Tax=Leucobacter chromiireducens TaxID=283877 RepID=UPI00192960BC|nr:hypothetical protein [Leucobacter chromiireducens]